MTEPGLGELLEMSLVVPIRSSTGQAVDPLPRTGRLDAPRRRRGRPLPGGLHLARIPSASSARRAATRSSCRPATSSREPRRPASGWSSIPAAPAQIEVPAAVLPFLAAGIDPTTPEAMRARRPYGELPPLEAPNEVPQPFGGELQRELAELPQVDRAWVLRAGTGWTVGIVLADGADLASFDEVRNRLHGLANEHLAGHRDLAVTDLSAAAVREAYESVAGPWYVRPPEKPKGIMGRLFGE